MAVDRAVQYRGKAAECRQLAQSFSSDRLRMHYLQVAEAWDELAQEVDRLQQMAEQFLQTQRPEG
jgi:hypothetical protein